MSELVLVSYPGEEALPSLSPPATKVILALGRLGLEHRIKRVGAHNVKKFSPTGRVPALIEGERTLVDSVRILDDLEARAGLAHPLTPSEPLERARDRAYEHVANEALYWPLVFSRWCVPKNRERVLDGLAGSGFFKRAAFGYFGSKEARARCEGQGTGKKPFAEIVGDFARGVESMNDALGSGPYLEGREESGRGDFALAGILAQVGWRDATPELNAELAKHPALSEHAQRTFAACGLDVPPWL